MTLRHDADETSVRQVPGAFVEFKCVVCGEIKLRHLNEVVVKTCSTQCATMLRNSVWRYQNIPNDRKKQKQWQKEYKLRKHE